MTPDLKAPGILRTAVEYEAAVAEIDAILERDPVIGTPEHDRLEYLSVLVEAYEDEHLPAPPVVSPQQVVGFALEQHGLNRKDLIPILGSKSRLSEFFKGKRSLSKRQIAAIHERLGIPIEILFESRSAPASPSSAPTNRLLLAAGRGPRFGAEFSKIYSSRFDVRPMHAAAAMRSCDKFEVLRDDGLEVRIYAKHIPLIRNPQWLIVLEHFEKGIGEVRAAYKAFPEDPAEFAALTPLAMVRWLADRFGVEFTVGGQKSRFVLHQRIPLPPGGVPDLIQLSHGPGTDIEGQTYFKVLSSQPQSVVIALCFFIDVRRYRAALR